MKQFSVIVGRIRKFSTDNYGDAVNSGKEELRKTPTIGGLVQPVLIFDNSIGVWVALLTDDANGITVHEIKDRSN